MDWQSWILNLHAATTLAMVGLIWFVQVVHYPLFAHVDEAAFRSYAAQHVRRTGFVVAPLMLIECATATWLAIQPATGTAVLSYIGFGLLLLAWLSTALLQVPCHRRLEHGKDLATIQRLVATNWIRTVAWTGRGIIALGLLTA
tara:strand:- start:259 stop:690 length:432 start_codon:yes stop_codon:yes gene_type:complete